MLTRTLASRHLLTQANNLFYIKKKYYTDYRQNDEEDEDFPVVNLLKQIEWQWRYTSAAKLIVMNQHRATLMNFGEVLGDFYEQTRDYYSGGFVQNLNMASITRPPQLASALSSALHCCNVT